MIRDDNLKKKASAIADYQRGVRIREIRRKHGITLNALYLWLKEDSIPLRGGLENQCYLVDVRNHVQAELKRVERDLTKQNSDYAQGYYRGEKQQLLLLAELIKAT